MKVFITFFLLLTFASADSQVKKQYILNGKVTGKEAGKLYLRYRDQGREKVDSAKINNGQFVLTGYISEPMLATLSDQNENLPDNYSNVTKSFFISQAKMNISLVDGKFKETKITGSTTNDEWNSVTNKLYPLFYSVNQSKNEDSINYFRYQIVKYIEDFSSKYSNSIISAKIIPWLNQYGISNDSIFKFLNTLNIEVKKTYSFQKTKEGICFAINSEINHPAPDFNRTDFNGKRLRLSDFRGKYVLLDYWASWCIPCRELSPHLKELYNKYHSKGLEVIAISCDSKYSDWHIAIKQDSIYSFHNILSFTDADMDFLKTKSNMQDASFKGELRKMYNLNPIPAEILIDKEGIIVGRFVGSNMKDLENKIREELGK